MNIAANDIVFLDANILIFLFSPDFVPNNDIKYQKYSAVFTELYTNKQQMVVNSLVISEFINKCLRIDFEKNFQDSAKSKTFKSDYRTSQLYFKTLTSILSEVRKILSFAKQIDDEFSSFGIFAAYAKSVDIDFNDHMIAESVIKNNYKLLTDDRDFQDLGINISWHKN